MEQYALPDGAQVLVDHGEEVTEGMVLATMPETDDSGEASSVPTALAAGRVELSGTGLAVISDGGAVEATVGGRIELSEDYATVIWEDAGDQGARYPHLLIPDGKGRGQDKRRGSAYLRAAEPP